MGWVSIWTDSWEMVQTPTSLEKVDHWGLYPFLTCLHHFLFHASQFPVF